MICINLPSTDPYFNLAVEEFFLKNSTDDILILWQSIPSVVVGKHQNMMAEVNYPYVMDRKIPVIRRLSGGGTVFHDLGNINFTYIANGKEGHIVDFKRFTQPIVDFLNEMGVPACLSGRNDILVDGFKFSGNAEHVFKSRVLHHGTILFSADLNALSKGIHPTGGTYSDSSVKSVRSKVANLQDYFNPPLTVDSFRSSLFGYLLMRHYSAEYNLSEEEVGAIQSLADSKYRTWAWNFGYSPDYKFTTKADDGLPLQVELSVSKGIIREAFVRCKGEDRADSAALLVGVAHDDFPALKQALEEAFEVGSEYYGILPMLLF